MVKLILIGYEGSRTVRNVSSYLIEKYTKGLKVHWFEYDGEIEGWGKAVSEYLKTFDDKNIIFALDDYLLSEKLDWPDKTDLADPFVLAKLCLCTEQENEEYPVTTQYTLWNREYLISLLEQITTPWDFEIKGSLLFKEQGKKMLHVPVAHYFTNSSLSSRWEGIRLDGLSEEDVKIIQQFI